MTLCPATIKRHRQEHGWSQEHLAEVAGISLRTVQRVEMDGGCSPETHMALASSFDVPPKELLANRATAKHPQFDWSSLLGFLIASALILVAVSLSIEVRLFFNMPGLILVLGLTMGLSLMSSGSTGTRQVILSLRALFQTPTHDDLSVTPILRRLIHHSYVAGLMALGIGLLQMLYNGGFNQPLSQDALAVLSLPIIYSLILSELIIRPVKMRIERTGIT